jgi:hypothetical protein
MGNIFNNGRKVLKFIVRVRIYVYIIIQLITFHKVDTVIYQPEMSKKQQQFTIFTPKLHLECVI